MTAVEFVTRFLEVQRRHGWRASLLPTQISDAWAQFIEEVEEGYGFDISEYWNDLSVRDQIEQILSDRELAQMDEIVWVRERIVELDERFSAQLQKEVLLPSAHGKWWDLHPPKKGGVELLEDFKSLFDVEIELVDE